MLLKELQDKSRQAIYASEEVKQVVSEQVVSVGETKEKYEEITDGIQMSLEEIGNIIDISEQMEVSRTSVNQVVEGLAAIAEENAASTEETSAASEQMLVSMVEVEENSQHLTHLSTELIELISSFDLQPIEMQIDKTRKKKRKRRKRNAALSS